MLLEGYQAPKASWIHRSEEFDPTLMDCRRPWSPSAVSCSLLPLLQSFICALCAESKYFKEQQLNCAPFRFFPLLALLYAYLHSIWISWFWRYELLFSLCSTRSFTLRSSNLRSCALRFSNLRSFAYSFFALRSFALLLNKILQDVVFY